MFVNLKTNLDDPAVRRLISESAWDQSLDATDKKIVEFRNRDNWHLYGWLDNEDILGVLGVLIHSDWIEINNIAVDINARKRGIGKAMINALQKKFKTTIKAETDDDSIGFYRRCGFCAESFMKTYASGEYRRYNCVLQI